MCDQFMAKYQVIQFTERQQQAQLVQTSVTAMAAEHEVRSRRVTHDDPQYHELALPVNRDLGGLAQECPDKRSLPRTASLVQCL